MNPSSLFRTGVLALLLALSVTTTAGGPVRAQPTTADKALNLTLDTRQAFPGSFGAKAGQTEKGTLDDVAGRAISMMLQLLATIGIAVCIFGSYRMVTSMGNSGTLKKGQDAFINAVTGTIIILLSYVIVALVQDLILQVA